MKIEYDPAMRDATLEARDLDMGRVAEVLEGGGVTFEHIRFEYAEKRFVTIGRLDGRMVVLARPPHGDATRIISMRKANDREEGRYGSQLG